MKIGFLTSEYPHPKTKGLGGIGTSIRNLAAGLYKDGCQVIVLVYGQDKDEVFKDEGVVIYKIRNIKVRGWSLFLTQKKIKKLIDKLYTENKIEIVEAPDWTGITSFIQPEKCPVVIKMNGSDTYFCSIEKRSSKWKNRFLERRALKKADGLAAVSQFTADYTADLFQLKKTIEIIPNGINLEFFTKSNTVITQNTLLYFGTLIRKKGVLEIPQIFNQVLQKVPDATLILAGKDSGDITSGSASTWQLMQPLFSEKALKQTQYLGVKPYHEIRQIIEKASICLFPSFAEALPVSWLEAMALEKPIVASNIGWAEEMIADGKEGFLVDPKHHELYAEKIVSLLNNPQLAESFGVEARKKVAQKFQTNLLVEKNKAFYRKVINI